MELQMHLHRWERREPDWSAAAVSGFAAGAVLMVLELLWAAFFLSGTSPWRISQLVAAMVMGTDPLQLPAGAFSVPVVVVALATHYVLGIAFGMVLGFIAAGFHYDTGPGVLAVVGLLFGGLLYLFSFYFATQAFTWLIELRGWPTLVAHLVFGVTASLLYWKLARRPSPQRTT